METISVKPAIHASPSVESVEIPADIVEALEAVKYTRSNEEFAPWQDEALRRYWAHRSKEDVARIIGMPEKRCRKRVKELGL